MPPKASKFPLLQMIIENAWLVLTTCTDNNPEKGIIKMGNFLQNSDFFSNWWKFENLFIGIFVSVVTYLW